MIEHQLLTFASTCLISLDRLGFTISVTEDLDGWQARMIEIGKPSNHPMMSPQWHDFAHPEAFGVQLSANGNLVGGVAARYHDLGQETLGQYWGRSYKRLYGNGADIPVHSPARKAATEVTGKVVYLGELFVTPDFRSTGGAALVMNYLFLLCAIRWKPSWIYGFIRQKDVLSGKPLQYGFRVFIRALKLGLIPQESVALVNILRFSSLKSFTTTSRSSIAIRSGLGRGFR